MEFGLEVDGRDNSPVAQQQHGEGDKYIEGIPQYDAIEDEQAPQQPPRDKRFCMLRPITLLLSIALFLALVLAVVVAGVAGSLAAKRDTRCVRPHLPPCASQEAEWSDSKCAPTVSNSSLNTSFLYSSSTIYNPFHVNDSPFVPSSNCTALGDLYTSFITQTQFKPLCNTKFVHGDIYSVYVYYFTDCIEACSAWNRFPALNRTCRGVTFDYNYSHSPKGQYGNCWLKSSLNVQKLVSNRTFSASLLQG